MPVLAQSGRCLCAPFFCNKGVGDVLVVHHRENERDVHVDAFGDQRGDRGQAGTGGRNFDHDIGAAHGCEQPPGLCDRAFGIMGKQRWDFDAHIAIKRLGAIINRSQQVGSILNVFNNQLFVNLVYLLALFHQLKKRVGIIVAIGYCFIKDGRIGSHTGHADIDEPFQFTGNEQSAANVIIPETLTEVSELVYKGFHLFSPLAVNLFPCRSFIERLNQKECPAILEAAWAN